MNEWRSRPPQPTGRRGPGSEWVGMLAQSRDDGGGLLEFCHDGVHRTAEAALACSRRKVKRLNRGGAR